MQNQKPKPPTNGHDPSLDNVGCASLVVQILVTAVIVYVLSVMFLRG